MQQEKKKRDVMNWLEEPMDVAMDYSYDPFSSEENNNNVCNSKQAQPAAKSTTEDKPPPTRNKSLKGMKHAVRGGKPFEKHQVRSSEAKEPSTLKVTSNTIPPIDKQDRREAHGCNSSVSSAPNLTKASIEPHGKETKTSSRAMEHERRLSWRRPTSVPSSSSKGSDRTVGDKKGDASNNNSHARQEIRNVDLEVKDISSERRPRETSVKVDSITLADLQMLETLLRAKALLMDAQLIHVASTETGQKSLNDAPTLQVLPMHRVHVVSNKLLQETKAYLDLRMAATAPPSTTLTDETQPRIRFGSLGDAQLQRPPYSIIDRLADSQAHS